jgi:hypothetical protein
MPASAVHRLTNRSVVGDLSFDGLISKLYPRTISGTLTFVGSISRRSIKILTASLTFLTSLQRFASAVQQAIRDLIAKVTRTPKPEANVFIVEEVLGEVMLFQQDYAAVVTVEVAPSGKVTVLDDPEAGILD